MVYRTSEHEQDDSMSTSEFEPVDPSNGQVRYPYCEVDGHGVPTGRRITPEGVTEFMGLVAGDDVMVEGVLYTVVWNGTSRSLVCVTTGLVRV